MIRPVSAKQHVKILDTLTLGGLIIGILMIAIMGTDVALDNVVGLLIYAAVVVLLHEIVWNFVPVRCGRVGCAGLMRPKRVYMSYGSRLRYVCDTCLHVYDDPAVSSDPPPSLFD